MKGMEENEQKNQIYHIKVIFKKKMKLELRKRKMRKE